MCYKVVEGGGLIPGVARPIALNQTTPPSSPSDTLGTVVFTSDQKYLVVTVKGVQSNLTASPGRLLVYSVDAGTDAIISESPVQVTIPLPGGMPYSLTAIPGRQAFFGSEFAAGGSVYDYSQGWDNVNITTLSVPGQKANCWSAYSQRTNTYFLTDTGTGIVSEVQLDASLAPRLLKVRGRYL
jgi:hypothetical protein